MKKTKFDKNVQNLKYKPNTCLNSGEIWLSRQNLQLVKKYLSSLERKKYLDLHFGHGVGFDKLYSCVAKTVDKKHSENI